MPEKDVRCSKRWVRAKKVTFCAGCDCRIEPEELVVKYQNGNTLCEGCDEEYGMNAGLDEYGYGNESPGMAYSRVDEFGVYLHDGTKIDSTCGCEDYPCCVHGGG